MSLRSELDAILAKISTVPTKSADDPLTEMDWNTVVGNIESLKEAIAKIRDLPASTIVPGFLYVRLPGRPLPYGASGVFNWTEEREWQKIHEQYPGTFLRLAGENASVFKADNESVSYDEKVRDQNGIKMKGGGQMDAVQFHKHSYIDDNANGNSNAANSWNGWHGIRASTRRTDDIVEGRTDIETRPKNITVEMYVYKPY